MPEHMQSSYSSVSSSTLKEAESLKRIFEAKAKELGFSQREFGAAMGIGSQALVWQYLNGRTPLNLNVALKFAQGLNVQIKEFSPRLSKEMQEIVQASKHLATDEQAGNKGSSLDWVNLPLLSHKYSNAYKASHLPPALVEQGLNVSKQWAEHYLGKQFLNCHIHIVEDESMRPTLNSGDLVLIDTSIRRLGSEGVYLFRWNEIMLLRRVYAVLDGGHYCLRADASKTQHEIITQQQALGLDVIGKALGTWSFKAL